VLALLHVAVSDAHNFMWCTLLWLSQNSHPALQTPQVSGGCMRREQSLFRVLDSSPVKQGALHAFAYNTTPLGIVVPDYHWHCCGFERTPVWIRLLQAAFVQQSSEQYAKASLAAPLAFKKVLQKDHFECVFGPHHPPTFQASLGAVV
jgi:hypothetical protein